MSLKDVAILRIGITGSAVVALCCFTPILVMLLGAVGLSAWLGWIDFVLLPALALFLGVVGYGPWRGQTTACGSANAPGSGI